MSSFRFQKLKSAKQTLKYDSISVPVSLQRLRSIQNVLEQTGVDAILCILGLDSRYNEGCSELADYLCFDFFHYKPGVTEQKVEDEMIDDVIFCVKKGSVDVYCNPINYYFLLPYISHWRNLRLHCLRESDYVDEESSQDFKIESLIRMTTGCQKIGIPYFSSIPHGKITTQFDKMMVEKWPVIQAFALEDFAGGGFFTLKYEVTDVSKLVSNTYENVDPVALETIITKHLPPFAKQWDTMVTNETVAGQNRTPDLAERTVSEPLTSYFSHGKLGSEENQSRNPFVLFGTHSTSENLKATTWGGKPSMTTSKEASANGIYAHHMVGQIVAPKVAVAATRTYFFEPRCSSESNLPNGDKVSGQSKDFLRLQEIYVGCVRAVAEAIHVYSATNDLSVAEDAAFKVLEGYYQNKKNVQFKIVAYDQFHGEITLDNKKAKRLLKSAQLTVGDIESVEFQGQNLGSISFAETFYESNFAILHPDSSETIEGNCHILTENIPRYLTWPNDPSGTIQRLTASAGLGHCLLQGEEACLLNPTCHASFKNGPVYIYGGAVILSHPAITPILLNRDNLKHLALYDGDSPSVVAMLILTLKEESASLMPPYLKSLRSELIVAFSPKTAAYKMLFSKVLPGWKMNTMLPLVERIDTIPDHLVSVHTQLQESYTLSVKPGNNALKLALQKQPDIKRFQKHLETSVCLGNNPVLARHSSAFVGNSSDPGSFKEDELLLTIVTGTTGSHKEALCHLLTNMAKDDNRWALLRQPAEQTANFSPRSLQANLAAVFKQYKQKQNSSKSKKKRRAIVLTPGYADLAEVIQAIVNHPDPEICSTLKIGAVTACVNPANSYMVDRYSFPKLLEQCNYGFVNNIVFTGSSDKTVMLNEIQGLIRNANPDVNLLIAEKGMVTRTPDVDLILSETAFSESQLIKARYLTCPGWALGKFQAGPVSPPLSETVLRFSQPLCKDNLLKKLRGLKTTLKPHPFAGNIYSLRGQFALTDADGLFDFSHLVLSGETDLRSAENQPPSPSKVASGQDGPSTPFYVVFNGCELEEGVLKNWLRDCSLKKPEKKVFWTRKSLTKVEVKKVHERHHLEPLPDGWFYNGTQYISMAGDRSPTHPDLEAFLSTYLEEINSEVDKYNAQVDEMELTDLFD